MTTRELAENTFLAVLARLAMLVATAAMPAVGWLLLRGIGTMDDINRQLGVIHDRVLETSVTVQSIERREDDHEGRLRSLEQRHGKN